MCSSKKVKTLCINAPRFHTFAIFDSLEPDETEVITDEELLELDNRGIT